MSHSTDHIKLVVDSESDSDDEAVQRDSDNEAVRTG